VACAHQRSKLLEHVLIHRDRLRRAVLLSQDPCQGLNRVQRADVVGAEALGVQRHDLPLRSLGLIERIRRRIEQDQLVEHLLLVHSAREWQASVALGDPLELRDGVMACAMKCRTAASTSGRSAKARPARRAANSIVSATVKPAPESPRGDGPSAAAQVEPAVPARHDHRLRAAEAEGALLRRLSAEDLEVARLRLAGVGWDQIAARLGVDAQTLRKRWSRLSATLAADLDVE